MTDEITTGNYFKDHSDTQGFVNAILASDSAQASLKEVAAVKAEICIEQGMKDFPGVDFRVDSGSDPELYELGSSGLIVYKVAVVSDEWEGGHVMSAFDESHNDRPGIMHDRAKEGVFQTRGVSGEESVSVCVSFDQEDLVGLELDMSFNEDPVEE